MKCRNKTISRQKISDKGIKIPKFSAIFSHILAHYGGYKVNKYVSDSVVVSTYVVYLRHCCLYVQKSSGLPLFAVGKNGFAQIRKHTNEWLATRVENIAIFQFLTVFSLLAIIHLLRSISLFFLNLSLFALRLLKYYILIEMLGS